MFYNDITVKGTIGQVSTTICENETPPAFTNLVSATGNSTITYRWEEEALEIRLKALLPAVTTEVYTPTSGLNTTTFFRRVAISTSPKVNNAKNTVMLFK